MEKPYVISAELDMKNIDTEGVIRQDRVDRFRASLDSDLREMGKKTIWVPSGQLRNGISRSINKTNIPVISLDDRYISDASYYLGVSRGIDEELNDTDYASRQGYPGIEWQLGQIKKYGNEIVIADDVLFSGEMIEWLSEKLQALRVKIGGVVCGVAMREGIDRLAMRKIDVEAVRIFDEVDDEICERDFAFVRGSGRRAGSIGANALYFDNRYGRPEKWASIPNESQQTFFENSVKRNAELIDPAVPMSRIGKFVGYGDNGLAVDQLKARLEV